MGKVLSGRSPTYKKRYDPTFEEVTDYSKGAKPKPTQVKTAKEQQAAIPKNQKY